MDQDEQELANLARSIDDARQHNVRTRDHLRLAVAELRGNEREVRETAQGVTAIRSDESSQKAAVERRSRMQDRLAHARQKPAGPHRCSPG